MDTPAVQFCRVGLTNTNQQWWHDRAETARPQLNGHESAGGTSRNTRRSSQLCFSQGREDQWRQDTHKHCTASCTSKPSSVSVILWSPIYTLQTSCVLHVSCLNMCLSLAQASVSADITLPISPNPQKRQETAAHHQKFFGAFLSMESCQCISTMQCKVDQYMCVISKESFIMCLFTCLL